jgi:hypothetical protein
LHHEGLKINEIIVKIQDKADGVSKTRFSRAIAELLAKGFITLVHHGGTYKQDKSVYGLSGKWLLWHPGVVFEEREKRKVTRGYLTVFNAANTEDT